MTAPIAELPEGFRPLRSEEYDRLIDAGVFADGPRIELVGGVLIEMSPQSEPHIALILLLNRLFVRQAGDDYVVGAQTPIVTDDISQPEPDFTILPVGDYFLAKPRQAVLVVEISRDSLRFDLTEKARRYAAAGYPEYWVIDIRGHAVHVHRGPRPDGSWTSVDRRVGGRLAAVAAPPIHLDLDDVLGWTDLPDQ